MASSKRRGPGLVIAALAWGAWLACSEPRTGGQLADRPRGPLVDAPAAEAAPSTPPGSGAEPTPDGGAAPADGPGPPDAPASSDAPAACITDIGCPACRSCQGGTCVPITAGVTDVTGPFFCGGDQRCDGQGACRSILGQVCSRSDDCLSGFCRSSVCCQNDCAGSCRHCNLPGREGTCTDSVGPSPAIGCENNGDICLAANRCLAPDQGCTSPALGNPINPSAVAQTFVVGRNGRLVGVRFDLLCRAGEEATLEIQGVTGTIPDGKVLHTQLVRGPPTAQDAFDERWLIPLTTPVVVRSGDRLAVVIRFRGTPSCTVDFTRDCYAGGLMATFEGDPPTWASDPDRDIAFRTYVTD